SIAGDNYRDLIRSHRVLVHHADGLRLDLLERTFRSCLRCVGSEAGDGEQQDGDEAECAFHGSSLIEIDLFRVAKHVQANRFALGAATVDPAGADRADPPVPAKTNGGVFFEAKADHVISSDGL